MTNYKKKFIDNYLKLAGYLDGAAIISLIPGIGDAAALAIRAH